MAQPDYALKTTNGVEFSRQPPRVLIVDDEPRMLTALSELLRMRNHDVTAASSGRLAIELLRDQHFDLVLLDLNMPGTDGFAVMAHIERHNKQTATIVVSGDTTIDAAIRAMRQGVHDFVRKPYAPEDLLRIIDKSLAQRKHNKAQLDSSEQIEQSEKWHRYLVHQSPDILYTLDSAGRFTFLNDRAETFLGIARADLIGRHYTQLVCEDDLERAKYVLNERRTGKRASRDVELRLNVRTDASRSTRFLTVEVSSSGIYEQQADGAAGSFRGTYGVAKEVGDRKRAHEKILHQAYHDGLTGLPNRLLFRDRLSLAVAQAKRQGGMLAVMFIDLDRFKSINDDLGHAAGDQLLQAVAARLSKCLREGDTVARLGGDEFTLLLPNIVQREDAENAARKVLSVLSQPFRVIQQEHSTGASVGIAVYPDDGDTVDALIQNADIAMYDVKAQGRNSYAFFSEARNTSYSNRVNLGHELHKAIGAGQLELYYQPQVSTGTGNISGLEVLLRWNHPVRGQILPEEFIPLAQEAGTIAYMSDWVIRSACGQLKEWLEYGVAPVRLGINLAAEQIQQHDFVAKFSELLDELKIDPALLEIEITEGTMVRDLDTTQEKLSALSALGVKIAIDDFGMGYSSLSYLRTLPIHAIKIDRSFIADIKPDSDNTLVNAMMLIGKGLGLRLIAEGVETQEQLAFLKANGCDECQGYFISKPLNGEEVTRLLASGRRLLAE
jgi:diguanylate cyclase (GGDEF)-like protein/PAS domain S-box-containing protein